VHADQNSPRDAKKNLEALQDAPEDSTDAQEDVWERHADLVQELNALERKPKRNAEEPIEEVAETFTAEDTEEATEEPTTKKLTKRNKKLKKLPLLK